ncbi:hypothetical protein ACVWXV_000274 [Thermostichus sp. OS-CIW-21]
MHGTSDPKLRTRTAINVAIANQSNFIGNHSVGISGTESS